MSRLIDLTGRRFGKGVVLHRCPEPAKSVYWICSCDCGHEYRATGSHLKAGNVKSCGCLLHVGRPRHGMTGTPTHISWLSMRGRCKGNGNPKYQHIYESIGYAPEWESFDAFLADMGERPPGTSLDRIDGRKGYSKDNCRWASNQQQVINRRTTLLVEWEGEIVPFCTLAGKASVSLGTVRARLRRGWALKDAILLPLDLTRQRKSA